MKNKIIVIILAVSSLIIMSLLGTKLLNEDYSFKPRNDYYKLDTSYIRFETDEFTAYLKGTWEDIDSRNNQDYPVSFNQFLFMYQHENLIYNSETSKEEKVESIRIKFNFKAINSGLLGTVIKGVAVNQVNGRLHQVDEIFYDSKKNIVTKNNNTKPFKRIEYSKVGNINQHLTNTRANLT